MMWMFRPARAASRLPLVGVALLSMSSLLLVGCGAAGGANGVAGAASSVGTASARLVGTVTVNSLPTPSITAQAPAPTEAPPSGTGGSMVALTLKSAGATTDVQLGQFVQAQLPAGRTWSYVGQSGVAQPAVAPSGSVVNGVALWTFRASATGATTLHFTGKLICQTDVPCLPSAVSINFALRVMS